MLKKHTFTLLFLLALCPMSNAQSPLAPHKPTASDIFESIRKLNFLGSALYIAAHPDDENTRLISHLSNEVKARTAYLSLTRGDGGQNLIGSELSELLGVIRTQELLQARKIDGGEQFFSRAIDFGYSKTPEETLAIWDEAAVLADVVWVIRRFRPDVIINRFDHRTPGTTHGHHTASALLSVEAFDRAADPEAFPEQLTKTEVWQPKQLFFNASWWFYGSREKFEKANKNKDYLIVNTGSFFPSLGLSNGEIAALSRSKHQSQGFGSLGSRGDENEYLERVKGTGGQALFEGVNTRWSRIEGGDAIGKILYAVEENFDFKQPEKSLPELVRAYQLLKNRTDYWGVQKTEEIKVIIQACTALFLEAVAQQPDAVPGQTVTVDLEAVNRAAVDMTLQGVTYNGQQLMSGEQPLKNNQKITAQAEIILPVDAPYTAAFWLREKPGRGTYTLDRLEQIGLAEAQALPPVVFYVTIGGEIFAFEKELIHKYNNPATGEVYQPFAVLPAATVALSQKVYLFPKAVPKTVSVVVKAHRDGLSGRVGLKLPPGWNVDGEQSFSFSQKGEEASFSFTITPPQQQEEAVLQAYVDVAGERFETALTTLDYDHIPTQQVLLPAVAKTVRIDLEKNGRNIGYINGAGDAVAESLRQVGYEVTHLAPDELSAATLGRFDAVVVGIRAYNLLPQLAFKKQELLDYVAAGGNLIVQYNVSRGLAAELPTPYKLELSRNRITDEHSPVSFLTSRHPGLNVPNKISQDDFENWVQERGLYFPEKWDKVFTPLLRMNDPDEKPLDGSLLVAPHGQGHLVFTSLSFFRQLPAGVPGAYRLFVNLLSL